jgi:hypothetical protein
MSSSVPRTTEEGTTMREPHPQTKTVTIAGKPAVWTMIEPGHWTWGRFTITRETNGRSSVGSTHSTWAGPGKYRALGILWWIEENGRRGNRPCRSLDHAMRSVRNRVER